MNSQLKKIRAFSVNKGAFSVNKKAFSLKNKAFSLKKQKAFTLVEVLIASLILFSTLAMVAQIFSASTYSANKAAHAARFYQIHPAAISAIKVALRDQAKQRDIGEFSGELPIFGILYQWQAQRVLFLSPLKDFDESFEQRKRFGLFNVEVNASQGSKSQTFQFEVTTW